MSRYDLLPPNATQLERDVSRATSSLERVGEPVGIIRTAKRVDIPDGVVPWLIYEYGLGEILPYLGNNQRRALAEGLLWQRIRGTKEALRIALSWIEIEGLIEESEAGTDRWAEFQLGLEERTTGEQIIDDIVGVSRLSVPARSRLQRIYAVHDWRRAVYDQCSWDDGSIYDDHSGVRPRPDWPQISYGQVIGALVQGGSTTGGIVSVSATAIMPVIVYKEDIFRYDENDWDQGWHSLNPYSLLTNLEGGSAALVDCRSWATAGYWGNRTWADGLPYVIGPSVDPLQEFVFVHLPIEESAVQDVSPLGMVFVPAAGGAVPALNTTITRFGNASAFFTGSNNSGLLSPTFQLAHGTGDFCIEIDLFRPDDGQVGGINILLNFLGIQLRLGGYWSGTQTNLTADYGDARNLGTISLGQHVNITIDRRLGQTQFCVNGELRLQLLNDTFPITSPGAVIGIGRPPVAGFSSECGRFYLNQFRLTLASRYRAPFAPGPFFYG